MSAFDRRFLRSVVSPSVGLRAAMRVVPMLGVFTAAAVAHANPLVPNFVFPDGSLGFEMVASAGPAPINPGVLVGLNPQPLPPFPNPQDLTLNLGDPTGPIASNANASSTFELQWWLSVPGGGLSFPSEIPVPDANGNTQFTVDGSGGNPLFDVSFHVGPGPVDPTSWVMLNPQPLPPFPAAQGFALQFGDPTAVEFQITEIVPNGAPVVLSFSFVPEPSALLSIGMGLAALAAARSRAR